MKLQIKNEIEKTEPVMNFSLRRSVNGCISVDIEIEGVEKTIAVFGKHNMDDKVILYRPYIHQGPVINRYVAVNSFGKIGETSVDFDDA